MVCVGVTAAWPWSGACGWSRQRGRGVVRVGVTAAWPWMVRVGGHGSVAVEWCVSGSPLACGSALPLPGPPGRWEPRPQEPGSAQRTGQVRGPGDAAKQPPSSSQPGEGPILCPVPVQVLG
ncbi:unnamed protein product [Lepidochelys kempii]